MAVDYNSGDKVIYALDSLSYEGYLQAVLASSSIPAYVDGVTIGNKLLYDGGVRDHILSRWVLERFESSEIDEIVSVYSRPKEAKPSQDFKFRNILDVIKRTLELMTIEVSLSDEQAEVDWCNNRGIQRRAYHLPKLLSSTYDVDKEKIKQLYIIGRKLIEDEQPGQAV
jgi:predicted patatin/cPLA2 family phospholipase